MEQERDCQTIFFKDLFFAAVYKWKIALVAALIFAIAFGGYAMYSKKSTPVQGPSMTADTAKIAAQLKDNIADTEYTISKQMYYMENSLLMDIDPYQTYTAGFHMSVCPKSMESVPAGTTIFNNTPVILRAYRSYLTNNEVMDNLAEQFETETQYISELISLDTSSGSMLGVTVRGKTIEDCQAVVTAVQAALENLTPRIAEQIEEHSVNYIPFETGPKFDGSLYDTQNNANQKLTTLRKDLDTNKKELNNLPIQLVPSTADPVKLTIFGVILGVGIVACYAWAQHICSRKIYSQRVLQNITGIKVLGCQPVQGRKFFLDRWLNKLEGRHIQHDQVPVMAAAIKNLCDADSHLLVIGNCQDTDRKLVLEALQLAGIACTDAGSLFDSPNAFEKMATCTHVLMTEACGQSTYEDVRRAMAHIADQNKILLGCILFNG